MYFHSVSYLLCHSAPVVKVDIFSKFTSQFIEAVIVM